MTLSAQQRDVLIRAGKTFLQGAGPIAVAAYTTWASHSGPFLPALEAGLISAGGAAVSVVWNGLGVLIGNRRASQLEALGKAIDAAVAKAAAPASATVTVAPPAA